ncbi:hypothetical protein OGAPHI_006003 [Ogataea philodendri]|uniref:Uncharacterized protein n=1 Tax=Ogataea philodendri TaxID=1378263 RepID=A0A9P8NYH2_9ASCO|nr:uncharacterized protein OGAPHI_006003 [Ogataea philodendri]KAH3661825.1 hypothetical protein OGAPHI_006003 [Ogataea philodendri]
MLKSEISKPSPDTLTWECLWNHMDLSLLTRHRRVVSTAEATSRSFCDRPYALVFIVESGVVAGDFSSAPLGFGFPFAVWLTAAAHLSSPTGLAGTGAGLSVLIVGRLPARLASVAVGVAVFGTAGATDTPAFTPATGIGCTEATFGVGVVSFFFTGVVTGSGTETLIGAVDVKTDSSSLCTPLAALPPSRSAFSSTSKFRSSWPTTGPSTLSSWTLSPPACTSPSPAQPTDGSRSTSPCPSPRSWPANSSPARETAAAS